MEVESEPCYKFVYTGCDAKGNVGTGGGGSGSGSGGNNNNNNDDNNHHWDDDDDDDDDDDNDGGGGTGPVTLKASCKDNKPQPTSCSSQITYNKCDEFNKSPLKKCGTTTPTVFKADKTPIKCKMTFDCGGSGTKPNGCFTIHGTIQKEPTPPVGNLNFAVGEYSLGIGTHPDGVATIIRD